MEKLGCTISRSSMRSCIDKRIPLSDGCYGGKHAREEFGVRYSYSIWLKTKSRAFQAVTTDSL